MDHWWPSLLIIGVAVAVGWIADRILMARLRAMARKTTWEYDDIVFDSLRGVTSLWSILIGLSWAVTQMPISDVNQHFLRNAIHVAWVASLTLVLSRVVSDLLTHSLQRRDMHTAGSILVNLGRAVIFGVGALVALQTMGVEILPVLTALGVGGLAVALALQDTLANLFAGLSMLASRGLRVGDSIKLDSGEEGEVTDITWRLTTVRTPSHNLVVVPNSKLAGAVVTNYSLPVPWFTLLVAVDVAYGSDLDQVERVCEEVARQALGDLAAGEPTARFAAFKDSGIECRIGLPVKQWTDQFAVRHHFIKALHARFRSEGIEIPFPTRTIIQRHG